LQPPVAIHADHWLASARIGVENIKLSARYCLPYPKFYSFLRLLKRSLSLWIWAKVVQLSWYLNPLFDRNSVQKLPRWLKPQEGLFKSIANSNVSDRDAG
jgi:hypothetical protein